MPITVTPGETLKLDYAITGRMVIGQAMPDPPEAAANWLNDTHVLALKLLTQGHRGGVFNLGTGKGFSVREILAAIATETGRAVPHAIKPRRPGDPAYLVADASAARSLVAVTSRPCGAIRPRFEPTPVRAIGRRLGLDGAEAVRAIHRPVHAGLERDLGLVAAG